MKNCFLILIFALLFSPLLKGQRGICGTLVTGEQMNLEKDISITPSKRHESVQHLNIELSVTVYIIKDTDHIAGITEPSIVAAIDRVNAAFSPVKLKFRICNFKYVDNHQFNSLQAASNQKDLVIQHHSPKTINLYFASGITDNASRRVAGYALMPSDTVDAIFIDKDVVDGNDIIHQFGHFFNLYDTNESFFGPEPVNDPNCNKKGDRCCDTPAETGASFDQDCNYFGTIQDSNNQYYVPSTNNFMGVGHDQCRCVFTNDQMNRVIYSVRNQKGHLR